MPIQRATVGKMPSGAHQALNPISRSRAAILAKMTVKEARNTAAMVVSFWNSGTSVIPATPAETNSQNGKRPSVNTS